MSCPRPNVPRSDPKDIGELAEPLRSRIWTATKMAPRRLLILNSGYRDPGRQWDLRHDRCRGRECDRRCKGYPTTGLPAQWDGTKWVGGSKHQHRKAADMAGLDLDWLIRNRFAFGLVLTVRGERWHFEAEGVDYLTGRWSPAPTVRIIPYPTGETRPDPQDEEPFTVAQYDEIKKALAALDDKIVRLSEQVDTVRGDGWTRSVAIRELRQVADQVAYRVASMHQGNYGESTGYAGGSLKWPDDRLRWSEVRLLKALEEADR